jgi:hypothetical protein
MTKQELIALLESDPEPSSMEVCIESSNGEYDAQSIVNMVVQVKPWKNEPVIVLRNY